METVNIHDAKTHLSRLVERAARGELFVIARAGKPLVKVVPLAAPTDRKPRRLGFLQGADTLVPDNFDRLAEAEIQGMFEGRE
jgi:prevent-host-death family protein